MTLREIVLTNFRCFGAATTVPFSNFTILAGANSAGKSSAIGAILALRQSWETRDLDQGKLLLRGDLVDLGPAGEVVNASAAAVAKHVAVSLDFSFGEPAKQLKLQLDVSASRSPHATILNSLDARHLGHFANHNFQYVSADRIAPDRLLERTASRSASFRQVGPKGSLVASFLTQYARDQTAWTGQTDATGLPVPTASKSTGVALGDALNMLLGFVLDRRLVLDLKEIQETSELVFVDPGCDGTVARRKATSLGFGVTHCLPVLAAIAGARPGDLLVIENPEANLHPAAQFRLTEALVLLASAGVQVVLETHSDHVLNAARLMVAKERCEPRTVAINYFGYGGHGPEVAQPQILLGGALDRWPSGFFDQWSQAVSELVLIGVGKP